MSGMALDPGGESPLAGFSRSRRPGEGQGRDLNDDYNDTTLISLMNIYRSGDANIQDLIWDKYSDKSS